VAPGLKRKIRGIIHDESATGKTVFIEPTEVVEANNRIRELEGEERREIIRILTEVSKRIRPRVPEILSSYDFLAEVDFIRAKALLALQMGGVKAEATDEPVMEWRGAVHPLLQISLAKHGKKVVPLDIKLNQKQRILIISGPNAGGKSVCLKTVGLLQYMWQCGLLIPVADGSRAGLFRSIFIDIGDEQSIEDDLSTYSSHLTNLKVMMKQCGPDSLILIDEFGGGTEPQIGGAIAEAVLKRFHQKGAFGVITTHYQNLKHFADDHEGVVNGAMLYDRHLMQALYQLEIGNPGSSFAVEIARKIGIPEDVIADATEIVGVEYINADKYLQDIVRDKRYWEQKRQQIRKREKQMEETIAKYETEMAALEKSRKEILKTAKEDAERILTESNAKIENTIRTIKEAQAEKERTRAARQELAAFRADLDEQERLDKEQREEAIARKMERLKAKQDRKKNKKSAPEGQAAGASSASTTGASASISAPKAKPIEAGDTVRIKGQTSVGEVTAVNGKNAQVTFGNLKTTVALARLERASAPTAAQKPIAKSTFVSAETQDRVYEKKLAFKQDIDVRGMRGDEAIQAVTYFIDDAILLGINRVRILHGTGGGILRTLIRDYLSGVPGVAHFQDEHVQFGGAGITVVDLE
jgi:DNA mismatch repair protein MutS2